MPSSEWLISHVELKVAKVSATGHILEQITRSIQVGYETLGDGIDLALAAIPGGDFLMGSPSTEEGWHPNQSPQHMVSVAPFWMARYPITQAQWQIVAQWPKVQQSLTPNPFCFSGANYPAEQISWPEAVEFCARLSAHTKRRYRLPSEAEWEYACRATSQTPFYFGETITTDLANYSGVNWEYEGKICNKGFYGQGPEGCDRCQTTAVGSIGTANLFGLMDMHGNVREWCADCWHDHYEGAPMDGSAWITGENCRQRVLRGGSWNGGPRTCRSAFRSRADIDSRLYDIGFRVVCDLESDPFNS